MNPASFGFDWLSDFGAEVRLSNFVELTSSHLLHEDNFLFDAGEEVANRTLFLRYGPLAVFQALAKTLKAEQPLKIKSDELDKITNPVQLRACLEDIRTFFSALPVKNAGDVRTHLEMNGDGKISHFDAYAYLLCNCSLGGMNAWVQGVKNSVYKSGDMVIAASAPVDPARLRNTEKNSRGFWPKPGTCFTLLQQISLIAKNLAANNKELTRFLYGADYLDPAQDEAVLTESECRSQQYRQQWGTVCCIVNTMMEELAAFAKAFLEKNGVEVERVYTHGVVLKAVPTAEIMQALNEKVLSVFRYKYSFVQKAPYAMLSSVAEPVIADRETGEEGATARMVKRFKF